MATHKQGGKTVQHKRPTGKRLGVKIAHGEKVVSGQVLVRQRGTKLKAGIGVKVGRDHTLYAETPGVVKFTQKFARKFVSISS